MKKTWILIMAAALACPGSVCAKKKVTQPAEEGFVFTTVKEAPLTSIKNQAQSGTCWAYSTLSYFEAELLRLGKGEYDLSEMFVAHKTYEDRATASVRMHGDVSYSQGGSAEDVVYCMKHYGIVPENAMPKPGSPYGADNNNFNEFFAIGEAYVNAVAKSKLKKLTPAWKKGFNCLLDTYLGQCPETFVVDGKEYTPKSYQESLGLNMDDYVSITSYTHHPFYSQFVIEVQDNWRWELSYNLPLDEMMQVIDNAVNNGFTLAWGTDVSEQGFTRDGIAVMPDVEKAADLTGSDMAHWLGLSAQDKRKELTSKPLPEIEVTQEMRQEAYDNWETTDDHGMLIYGLAKDQNGKEYYMVKNSWGEVGRFKGIWYASKAFTAYKTMNILVHKDAIPEAIARKMGLK